MIRFLGFLFRLALFVALALWLADRPGTARIVWHDYVIETSAAVLGVGTLILGFVFYLLFRFWHLIKHGPERWKLHRKLQKLRRGHDHLTHGLIAIAGGNAFEAGRLAVNARKLLGTTAATQLLHAQAAQLAGDHGAARDIFRALAASNDTAVLGYRGLIMEARREGNWAEVEQLVEKLHDIKSNTPWLNLIRFELLARRQDWDGAALSLDKVAQSRLVETSRAKQMRACLLAASSQKAAATGQPDKALHLAEQAVRLAPDWTPALIVLVQQQLHSDQRRAAQRTVEKNWPRLQHPQLASLYVASAKNPLEGYKQIEKLCGNNLDAPESRLALAETALAADIWGEARRHLIALISRNQATQAVFRMLARLERRESGDEQAALQWMMKAVDAAPDPTWLCTSCGGSSPEWRATCSHCGSFDTLQWQSPGVSRTRSHVPLLASDEMF
jgi:HemY protein